jgi:ribonuclease BN (tRNA processing enzyme)
MFRLRVFLVFCFSVYSLFADARSLPACAGMVRSDETPETKVVLLGTGTPIADPERSGPSVAVIVGEVPYLVDFGPGVVRRAAAAAGKGVEALKVTNIKRVFATHLHSDHTAGYPDLILTPWVLGRDEPLEVYGPEGLQDMTDHILAAYERDIFMRLYGLEPANSNGYKVIVHEIEPGIVYVDSNVTVEAFPVRHGSWHHAFGFKFRTPDRIVVISGDTAPCDSLVEAAKGCDILVHEVYCRSRFERRAPEWRRYHASFHTSTKELAEIASAVEPKLLILYHQLFWGAAEDELLAEIGEFYKGNVVSGKDLEIYYLE